MFYVGVAKLLNLFILIIFLLLNLYAYLILRTLWE